MSTFSASSPSANTIKEKRLLHIISVLLCGPSCGLSGLSLAVRETRPNCWLIGWQRSFRLWVTVMSRRGDTQLPPVLHLSDRVRVSASHHQYTEPAFGLDRILSSSGLYMCTIQRDNPMEGGGGGRIILPFIHHSDLHFPFV